MIKFALVADVHHGPEKEYEGQIRKLSRHSLNYLSELNAEIENVIRPHFVVQLGDLIEDGASYSEDRDNYLAGMKHFNGFSVPSLSVIGNHDQVNIEQSQLQRLNNLERLYYSLDIAGLHCVVLFTSTVDHTDNHISSEQLDWLKDDLARAQQPALVFLHHPLDEQNLSGNVWFEKYPDYCFVEERAEIRQILAESGKVKAVFNGHVHRNNVSTIDGIHYITVQSLVEKVGEPDICSRAYTVAELDGKRLKVKVHGRDAADYDLVLL
jgi:Icc protein